MPQRLQREIDKLKKRLLSLGAVVEEQVRLAVKSVADRDALLAQRVIDIDMEIDLMEVDMEEECLKVMALHQPVANDLRYLIAMMKINNDLERLGDLAVNIAGSAAFLARKEPIAIPFDFPAMSEKAQAMLRGSLDALINRDPELALSVCKSDDEIDNLNREMYKKVEDMMRSCPANLDSLIHLISISKNLERIADHTTNIAEDVIYLAKGEIIRHQRRLQAMTQGM